MSGDKHAKRFLYVAPPAPLCIIGGSGEEHTQDSSDNRF
jgi:hypothetical protein